MKSKRQIMSGKILVSFLLLSIACVSYYSNAQQLSTPLGYMEYISAEFKNVQKDTWDYTRAVAKNKSARKVENRRKDLLATINTAIGKIKRLKGFNGDSSYRDSCVSFLQINKAVIDHDYARIMQLEEIAEQSYDNMEAYMLAQQKADEILQEAGEQVELQEKAFAAAHQINLVESQDKITKKLQQSSRVYAYYNKIYLIFFKSYKQEAYLIAATIKGDINGMEQNKNSLLKFSTDGLEQLKDIGSFDGDASLKMAAIQILNFYKDEAGKTYPAIIDFQLKKDNFEKATKTMKNSGSKNHSKEEADAFNKAVKEYNQSVNDVNQKNNMLNETRSRQLDNWNSKNENFTSSHIG